MRHVVSCSATDSPSLWPTCLVPLHPGFTKIFCLCSRCNILYQTMGRKEGQSAVEFNVWKERAFITFVPSTPSPCWCQELCPRKECWVKRVRWWTEKVVLKFQLGKGGGNAPVVLIENRPYKEKDNDMRFRERNHFRWGWVRKWTIRRRLPGSGGLKIVPWRC